MNTVFLRVLLVLAGITNPTRAFAQAALCDGAGCFSAQATGYSNARITGRAAYDASTGRLIVILTGGTSPVVTMVITRDTLPMPRNGAASALALRPCTEDDEPAPARADQFHISLRGGDAWSPSWLAVASAGTLTLSTDADGLLNGVFTVTACGMDLPRDEPMTIELAGSFRAARWK
jgi:hypothetical protein